MCRILLAFSLLIFSTIVLSAPVSVLEIKPKTVEEAQFYNVLIRITRCTTVSGDLCHYTITNEPDLLYYFKYCLRLNLWELTYHFPEQSALQITLTKDTDVKNACLITVQNTANHVRQTCLLTKKEVEALSKAPELNDFFMHFDNTPHYGLKFQNILLRKFNACLTNHPH